MTQQTDETTPPSKSEALARELALQIDRVEEDMADDLAHADATGERPDLYDYEVSLSVGTARAVLAALRTSGEASEQTGEAGADKPETETFHG